MSVKAFLATWPIAGRLTVLYSLSLLLLLAVASTFLDWTLRTDMKRDTDQFLAVEMQSVRALIRQRPNDTAAWREEVERQALASISGYARSYVRIVDERGKTVVETPGMTDTVSSDSFPGPMASHGLAPATGETVKVSDGRSLATAAQWVEILQPESKKWLIQVAFDRTHDEAIIADYRRKVVLVLLVGILVSAALGFSITKAGLRPLAKITSAVRGITPDHLAKRVSSTQWPTEIASLAEEFDSMLQRLERSFALLSQFSADLAHELRTPINNLRGEAEIALGRSRTVNEYQRVLESALEEYERLSRVIDSLLFFARTDSGNLTPRSSPINVHQEMDAVLEYFQALAEEKGIGVIYSGNALLHADPVLFRRALTNVLSNAFYYTLEKGKVTVIVSNRDNAVTISVSDTGIGIDQGSREKVLDRFFRTEKARSLNPTGSGLGLSMVKAIMDIHEGSVGIDSIPSKGTTVTLRFPQG